MHPNSYAEPGAAWKEKRIGYLFSFSHHLCSSMAPCPVWKQPEQWFYNNERQSG